MILSSEVRHIDVRYSGGYTHNVIRNVCGFVSLSQSQLYHSQNSFIRCSAVPIKFLDPLLLCINISTAGGGGGGSNKKKESYAEQIYSLVGMQLN